MSNTRTASPGMPPRQERYASSYERGLLGNLVAKRTERLAPLERASVWFLQWLSWQPGGIEDAARTIGSNELERLCLDPDFAPAGLFKAVSAYRTQWIATRSAAVETDIGRRIRKGIDFSQSAKCLVLLIGDARIGKSFATKEHCERSAGLVRLVNVPPGNDDMAFYRAFAQVAGVACSLSMKAQQIRDRVEETVQGGQIAFCVDEAHYLWDTYIRPSTLPTRVNWILTALVNRGVPVTLIATPQFQASLQRVEKATGWTSTQLTGRITYSERLPDKLPMGDLLAVARSVYPEGDPASWQAMAAYADLSQTHLAAITALASRARWHAQQAGRTTSRVDDLRATFRECSLPIGTGTPRRSGEAGAALNISGGNVAITNLRIGHKVSVHCDLPDSLE